MLSLKFLPILLSLLLFFSNNRQKFCSPMPQDSFYFFCFFSLYISHLVISKLLSLLPPPMYHSGYCFNRPWSLAFFRPFLYVLCKSCLSLSPLLLFAALLTPLPQDHDATETDEDLILDDPRLLSKPGNPGCQKVGPHTLLLQPIFSLDSYTPTRYCTCYLSHKGRGRSLSPPLHFRSPPCLWILFLWMPRALIAHTRGRL